MIAFVSGLVDSVYDDNVVIESGCIGYRVYASAATISRLPAKGEKIKIYTHMAVKEDGITLYGFINQDELKMFTLLITVSGIGPRGALSILSAMNPADLMLAIITDDARAIEKAPGVGKKTASRLILELKDKISSKDAVGDLGGIVTPQQNLAGPSSEKQDAIDALIALGYGRSEAVKTVMEVALSDMAADKIIKLAIRKLNK